MALLKKTRQVNTRFTEEEYALLLLKARTERITVSDFIRQAAIGKKVSLSGIEVQEGQKIRCKAYETGEVRQGTVKKDCAGRLYISSRGDSQNFYQDCASGNNYLSVCAGEPDMKYQVSEFVSMHKYRYCVF